MDVVAVNNICMRKFTLGLPRERARAASQKLIRNHRRQIIALSILHLDVLTYSRRYDMGACVEYK